MNTVRIEKLALRCRGISPANAGAAVGELASALHRQLGVNGAGTVETGGSVIRVAGTVPPAMLADTIAARLAKIIRAHASPGQAPGKM